MGKEKEFITEITMRSCLLEHINSVFKKKKSYLYESDSTTQTLPW